MKKQKYVVSINHNKHINKREEIQFAIVLIDWLKTKLERTTDMYIGLHKVQNNAIYEVGVM